jgi:hypothetical protein
MACSGCARRREEIAKIVRQVGTIVFGGKRVLSAPGKAADVKR